MTDIQISQETGKMVWYSHFLKNFPEFVVIHTVKGFGIVSKAKVDVFLELSCFFDDPLSQWFSNLSRYQNHLESSLKLRLLGLTPEFLISFF